MNKKYCKDCIYIKPEPDGGYRYAKCGHPELSGLVDGSPSTYCSTERSGDNCEIYPCGKEGKLFELKPITGLNQQQEQLRDIQPITTELINVNEYAEKWKPCPWCHGDNPDDCPTCKGNGHVRK